MATATRDGRELIQAPDADVVGIQEAFYEQVVGLRRDLPQYEAVGVGRDDGRTQGEHCLILYRKDRLHVGEQGTFWFSDTPEVAGSSTWGNRVTRICTWARFTDLRAQASFLLYNLHIDHESQPSRERSLKMLAERLHRREGRDPVIITGDFNAGEDNPALDVLRAATEPSFRDSFRVVHPEEKAVSTYHDFHGGTDGEKIDYIWVSPEFRVLDAGIVRDERDGRFPSDHYPVTAHLALP